MKKTFLISCSLLIISLLSSCGKDPINPYEGKIHVEGQVLEKGKFPNPIPNASVILYEVKSNDAFGPVYFIPIDTVVSDKNGNYVIERDAAGLSGFFHISASADPEQFWNRTDEPVKGEGIRANAKIVNTLFIQPYGFTKISVKNSMPVDDDDNISICGSWCNNIADNTIFRGKKIDNFFVKKIIANDSIRVSHEVEKKGKNNIYQNKTYFVPAHDTLKININY